jgi:cytochrome c oxidase assembly protein subunit 15
LLAASVGLITIGLVIVLIRSESRRWVMVFGCVALVLVIFQGVLGGLRVLFDERTLAMLHGCTGPLFFALTVALAVITSRTWTAQANPIELSSAGVIRCLSAATAVLAYLQIVVGAVVRHVPLDAQPSTFMHAVKGHLYLAAVLALHILALAWLVQTRARGVRPLGRLSLALVGLLIVQAALGAGTWIVKFAVPSWAAGIVGTPQVSVQEGGWLQTHIITAHVATGSLILAAAVALALYAQRWLAGIPAAQIIARRELGAAV